MPRVDLRDYQADAFERARDAVRAGKRRILIVAPTGGGKTVLASALMEMVREKGNRANFVIDRLSLLTQTSETFDRYDLDHGVIQSQHVRYRPSLPIQICSVQTLSKRGWPDSHVDVLDEAHVLHETQKKRMESGATVVLGLTATPFTKGLGKWFDTVINVTTTRKLIEQGWLVPYRIFSCTAPDMTGVTVKSSGEWDEGESSKKALEVVGDVVQEYLRLGEDRRFICSAVDVAHVEELARQFLSAGINVATFTYRDGAEDREDTLAEFRKINSSIRGLITVTAASRGMDCPPVSCVIMARPLRKSLAEHIQLWGRGLRISPETGKKDCLVLCHSGNAARFFVDCEEFFDNGLDELDDGKAKKKPKKVERPEAAAVKCPSCGHLHKPMPNCPNCGHVYPRKKSVEHIPGTLKELLAGGGKFQAALDIQLWPQVCGYVLERREGDAARKQALAIYKSLTGNFPRGRYFEDTVPANPTHEVRSRIVASQIRFSKSKKAPSNVRRVPDNWGERRA